jgi:chromosome segregation ATPase
MKSDHLFKSESKYIDSLERQVRILEDKADRFKKDETVLTKAIKNLENRIETLKTKQAAELEQKQDLVDSYKERIQSIDKKEQQYNKTINQLGKELGELNQTIDEKSEKIAGLEETINSYTKLENIFKSQLAAKQKEILGLQETFQIQKNNLSQVEQTLKSKESEIDRLIDSFDRQKTDLKKIAELKEEELSIVKKELNILRQDSGNKNEIAKIESLLRKQNKDFEGMLAQKESELTKLTAEIGRLTRELKEKEKIQEPKAHVKHEPKPVEQGNQISFQQLEQEKQKFREELVTKFNDWQTEYMKDNEDATIQKARLFREVDGLRDKIKIEQKKSNETWRKYSRTVTIAKVLVSVLIIAVAIIIIILIG